MLSEVIANIEIGGRMHVALVENVVVPKIRIEFIVQSFSREAIEALEIKLAHVSPLCLALYLINELREEA